MEDRATSRAVATFEGLQAERLIIGRIAPDGSPLEPLSFDLSVSRNIEIDGASFEVLEQTGSEMVLRRR